MAYLQWRLSNSKTTESWKFTITLPSHDENILVPLQIHWAFLIQCSKQQFPAHNACKRRSWCHRLSSYTHMKTKADTVGKTVCWAIMLIIGQLLFSCGYADTTCLISHLLQGTKTLIPSISKRLASFSSTDLQECNPS